jgi:hypothetical protein
VLAGPVPGPGGRVEDDRDHARGLSEGVRDVGNLPVSLLVILARFWVASTEQEAAFVRSQG